MKILNSSRLCDHINLNSQDDSVSNLKGSPDPCLGVVMHLLRATAMSKRSGKKHGNLNRDPIMKAFPCTCLDICKFWVRIQDIEIPIFFID
jgi:hypothetical protein